LRYQVCDDGYPLPAACATAWLRIEVVPVNDPPVVLNDTISTLEDTPVTTVILDNDSDPFDPEGGIDSSSVLILTEPAHGDVVVNPDGTVTYSPDLNYNGSDSYVYLVCDLGYPLPPICDTATVLITIVPVNDPPVAVNDTVTGAGNENTYITVQSNDYDVDGNLDYGSVIVIEDVTNGYTTFSTMTGILTFVPSPGWCGQDSLIYAIFDTDGASDTAAVFIDIVCDPPVAVDDSITIAEDETGYIMVLINDINGTGAFVPSTIVFPQEPGHGTVSVDPGNGLVTYSPDPGWCGIDIFTYVICDQNGLCDSATVTITIICDPFPVLPDEAVTEGDTPVVIPILNNDDPGADPACIVITEEPENGTVVINPDGTVIYYPAIGFTGRDCFYYQVCDTVGVVTGTAEVCVDVLPPPVTIPEVFTPNGDGINDWLVIDGLVEYYPNNEITIFNRWEDVVFKTREYRNDWQGTWQRNGQPLPDGTYYIVLVLDVDRKDQKPVLGFTTVHR
jgi:gliding motility-associated-like protein